MAANSLILHEPSPLGDAPWQVQMMWIVLGDVGRSGACAGI